MLETIDGVNCRWTTQYEIAGGNLVTTFSAVVGRELRDQGPHVNHVTPEIIDFVREYYAGAIAECIRRARLEPGIDHHVRFDIDYAGIRRVREPRIGSQLRIRRPNDYYVRDAFALHTYPANVDYEKARTKSIELLKSWLSPEQLGEYERFKYFSVVGSDSGKRYRLIEAKSYNILELSEAGEPNGNKFCVVPAQSVAMGDQLLAQKIWLETDETRTLKIANKILRNDNAATGNSILTISMITREIDIPWVEEAGETPDEE